MEKFVKQINLLKHTLGIDLCRLRKGQVKYNCYRNYFYGYDKCLEELVSAGYVDKL